jgi:hypothetical protein
MPVQRTLPSRLLLLLAAAPLYQRPPVQAVVAALSDRREQTGPSEVAIITACRRNDTAQLQRWGRVGVYVTSAEPFLQSVAVGASLNICGASSRISANVNQATDDGVTPLTVAVHLGNLGHISSLVDELRADINQGTYNS